MDTLLHYLAVFFFPDGRFWFHLVSWFSAFSGIAGAALISLNHPVWSKWAYPIWVFSSAGWIAIAVLTPNNGLLVIQVAYSFINVVGIFQWFGLRKPRLG